VYIRKPGTKMENKLNSYMDHMWDGFYTGQNRLSRFPALIEGKKGSAFDLSFTATPAKTFKFTLKGFHADMGTTVRLAYPNSDSRSIEKDGKKVEFNKFDDKTK